MKMSTSGNVFSGRVPNLRWISLNQRLVDAVVAAPLLRLTQHSVE